MTKEKLPRIAIYAVFIAVLINLTTGFQNVWSLLGRQMIADYGWTQVQATRPYSILTLVSAFISIIVGPWGEKKGHRYPILFGAAMVGFGLILSSMHQNPLLMCITAGAMLGMSSSSITGHTASNSMQWVSPKYKGIASGVVTSGFALSSLYMTPLINGLFQRTGMLTTFRICGLVCLIVIPVLAFLLPDTKSKKYKEMAMKISGNTTESLDRVDPLDRSKYKNMYGQKEAIRTYELWACWIMYFCGAIGGTVFVSQAVTIASTQVEGWDGVVLVMIMAFSNFIGRITVPALGDRLGVFTLTRILFAAQAVNWFLFGQYHSVASMVIGCILLGFTFGATVPMHWNWIGAIFGTKNVAALQGIVTTGYGTAGFVGPLIAAAIMDATGGYNAAFILMGICSAIGLAVSFTVKNYYDDEYVNKVKAKEVQA